MYATAGNPVATFSWVAYGKDKGNYGKG